MSLYHYMRKLMYTGQMSILFYTPYFYNRRQRGRVAHHKMRIVIRLSSNARTINSEVCSYL